ncbi:ACT domain-containing protein [Thalassotalea sp. Y01]|uniref:ACT domain-containing protein n=1 Tax=Thalassotalea sp. Y01 TaxID=2729613 RepID=UPI00145EEB02|nr:ACT domain-containing protein [Thalassotalea sp. Y01]NMP15894.1 ACT domain-containing protein [Thalassotalea sp. Y01]
MSGITDLDELLRSMRPKLVAAEFVFCTVSGDLKEYVELNPVATFIEPEGLTLVVEKSVAEKAGFSFSGTYSQIILTVHSSLEAVGLTAAVASKLASKGVSANVIAAYYHDHIFVQTAKADIAKSALEEFASNG